MDFDDLIERKPAPETRAGKVADGIEHKMHEGAVMVAYAMHLLRTQGAKHVSIYPDGEHGKCFDFTGWLKLRGFEKKTSIGTTSYGGDYDSMDEHGWRITIKPLPGKCDVVAATGNKIISAECKGGVINTKHSGKNSSLDKGLCEAVGRLMANEDGGQQVAVVPYTDGTMRLAKRMASRCAKAGIDIALIGERGEVINVSHE